MRAAAAAGTILLLLCSCSLVTPMARPSQDSSLVLWMPGAVSVQVIADWNEWGGLTSAGGTIDPSVSRMESGDGSLWTLPLPRDLETGFYRYAFLVDGWRWVQDPSNPDTGSFLGHDVSLLMVVD